METHDDLKNTSFIPGDTHQSSLPSAITGDVGERPHIPRKQDSVWPCIAGKGFPWLRGPDMCFLAGQGGWSNFLCFLCPSSSAWLFWCWANTLDQWIKLRSARYFSISFKQAVKSLTVFREVLKGTGTTRLYLAWIQLSESGCFKSTFMVHRFNYFFKNKNAITVKEMPKPFWSSLTQWIRNQELIYITEIYIRTYTWV